VGSAYHLEELERLAKVLDASVDHAAIVEEAEDVPGLEVVALGVGEGKHFVGQDRKGGAVVLGKEARLKEVGMKRGEALRVGAQLGDGNLEQLDGGKRRLLLLMDLSELLADPSNCEFTTIGRH
jgi:hypothetical protein